MTKLDFYLAFKSNYNRGIKRLDFVKYSSI